MFPLLRKSLDELRGSRISEVEAEWERGRMNAAPPSLTVATAADVPAIAALMNLAYRGAGADAGWTTEVDHFQGDRTSEELLREDIVANAEAALLVWRPPAGDGLLGCVWVAPEGDGIWYLGSLSIDPRYQNRGLGRKLLAAAEDWVRERGGRGIRMTVINVRDTLLSWYARRGYAPRSETEPFPYGDNRFGIPKRDDLHFVVLAKRLD
jgi:ribosomal protein S18 acetylase RimI-like enzyme